MSATIGSSRQQALIAFLAEQRRKAGMSQNDLAEKLKQHQSFVARLESGQRRVDVVELIDLAEAIGFDAVEAVRRIRAVKRS
ncbi:MAG: helix-turn-helix transcriptional regulator [Xanthobacteraceae bacterium]